MGVGAGVGVLTVTVVTVDSRCFEVRSPVTTGLSRASEGHASPVAVIAYAAGSCLHVPLRDLIDDRSEGVDCGLALGAGGHHARIAGGGIGRRQMPVG